MVDDRSPLARAVDEERARMSRVPPLPDGYIGLRSEIAQLKRENDALTARLAEADRRLSEIRDELCGNGFEISGWHNNGDMEPIDTWWEDNDWGPVEENGGRDE